ncbi:hypothetical protein FOA52_010292 [Chlamydomonas sp. UWO 241]|nr:hypothetical protein FOA52_010292 [Chlamydomonas sp. UWO 241]
MLRRLGSALSGQWGVATRSLLEPASASLETCLASTSGSSLTSAVAGAYQLQFARSKYTYRFKRQKDVEGLIYWQPTTPGQRHKISIDFDALGVYTGPPVPSLSTPVTRTGGRDHTGRLRVRGRGGGDARVLRTVDYDRRDLDGVKGIVQRVEADPNRSAFLALTRYDRAGALPVYRYHVAPLGCAPGSVLMAGDSAPVLPGCVLRLRDIPVGQPLHNLEYTPGAGGKAARAAHTSAVISVKHEHYAVVKMPSGELRKFPLECRATIGIVSNHLQRMINMGTAGANRARGRRPKVRGIAMNPVDHPHGGRTNGGRPSCTPWGVFTKGKRTRRRNNPSNTYIVMRKGGQSIAKFADAKKTAKRQALFASSDAKGKK